MKYCVIGGNKLLDKNQSITNKEILKKKASCCVDVEKPHIKDAFHTPD